MVQTGQICWQLSLNSLINANGTNSAAETGQACWQNSRNSSAYLKIKTSKTRRWYDKREVSSDICVEDVNYEIMIY